MTKRIEARYTNNPFKRTAAYVVFRKNKSDYFADSENVLNKKYEYTYFTRGDASKLLNMDTTMYDFCTSQIKRYKQYGKYGEKHLQHYINFAKKFHATVINNKIQQMDDRPF